MVCEWINYEKFIDKGTGSPLRINIAGADSAIPAKAYLVFNDLNYVMGGNWTKQSYNYFPAIPDGANITVFVLSYSGENILFGQKKITAGNSKEVEIILEVIPAGQVKKKLEEID